MGQSLLLVMQAAVKCSLTASVAAVDPRLGLVFLPAEGHGGEVGRRVAFETSFGLEKVCFEDEGFRRCKAGAKCA